MDQTARLDLPLIAAGQALKHVTHNEALARLDVLVQPVVSSSALTSPPSAPLEGEAYLVPAGAGGAWAGHADDIAAWQAGAWTFLEPADGWQVFDQAAGALKAYAGGTWIVLAAHGSGLPQLGINASADGTNRLTVAGAASLFTHSGAGHQLKINKAGDSQNATMLFQSNWSGRAEIGLAGSAEWSLKVSPNGSSWTEAMRAAASGVSMTFGGHVLPASDNARTLGSGTARWSAVWAANGVIQTSDRRLKRDIGPCDLGLAFICALKPVRFAWTDDPEGRRHYGLVAQEVLAAARQNGAADFGGHRLADPADPQSLQALNYQSLIAPLIAAVQTLTQRITALEALRS